MSTALVFYALNVKGYVGGISRIATPKIRELTIIYHNSRLSNLNDDIPIRAKHDLFQFEK